MKKREKDTELYIFLPESITHASTFSNYAIAVYSVLKMLASTTKVEKQCVTPYQLAYLLTEKENISKYTLNYIKCGLNELIMENVLLKISEIQKHYLIDCSNLWIDTHSENFTIITFNEIRKIFQIENTNNFLLLKYFIFLIGSISSKIDVWLDAYQHKTRVIGVLTIDKLAELSNISARSIIEYNKILETNNLIYIRRQNDFVIDENNNIKQLPNVYGRPCDKVYIDSFAENQKQFNNSYGYVEKTLNTNSKRSLAQKYQQLVKGGGQDYTKEEISDIYEYVITENEKYRKLYEKDGFENHLDKIRDTEIFGKYDFIKKK